MNQLPTVQSRSSTNGFIPRRVDGETGSRTDTRSQTLKSPYGLSNGGNSSEEHSRDRLIFVSTCLIGHVVEVHVKNGSVLSGIFHTINAEKDFGIVLKMARETKDSSVKGPKLSSEIVKRPQTMIIPARELVQVVAKDVSLTYDGASSGSSHEKRQDLMTDSAISQSRRVDVERELERWTPDKDDPQRPELENIFDKQWNRKWNQFEANEALFGVKTTFNEELYTTKLERGPQMREREREAMRIAREIEGEDTRDLHLAEERGIRLDEEFEFDEEARFSSVYRGVSADITRANEGTARAPSTSSSSSRDEEGSNSVDETRSLATDVGPMNWEFEGLIEKQHLHQGGTDMENAHKQRAVIQETESSKFEAADGHPPLDSQKLSASATAFSPSSLQVTKDPKNSSPDMSGGDRISAGPHSSLRPSSSTSSTSEKSVETSTSRVGSAASEKSTLNPHAKEFKLNPNAKSFVPTASVRPHALAADSSFYYPHNPAISQMHGLPVGMGSTFPGQQPVVYGPQGLQMQAPQGYINPAGSPYGQQMIVGQPRPIIYMPGYPQDMGFKGREF